MTLHGGGTREREVLEAQDSSAKPSPRPRSREERHRARFQGSSEDLVLSLTQGTYSLNRHCLSRGAASMGSNTLGRE